jgi:hypothetical protein
MLIIFIPIVAILLAVGGYVILQKKNGKINTTNTSSKTLADFKNVNLGTPYSEIEKKFGKPDQDIGSGIHIFTYTLSDSSQVWLGFADLNSLLYIKHRLNNGAVEDMASASKERS